jgi:hypothetical protein
MANIPKSGISMHDSKKVFNSQVIIGISMHDSKKVFNSQVIIYF